MVRVKKRYFVVQLERERDVAARAKCAESGKPFRRAVDLDHEPLKVRPDQLTGRLRDLVGDHFGDLGSGVLASSGVRVAYSNPATGVFVVSARHGPHRFVAAVLPFLTRVSEERVVPRLIHTGATVRQCFRVLEPFQKKQLECALFELRDDPKLREERATLERQLAGLKDSYKHFC